ncbi:MerR family transcriptional regulator [Microbacterium aurugineum]
MLSIGAFAQIGQVTHRMLRHWDTAGLLVPAHVDEFNGYRSYDPSQLERLHRIVALRQLGFGLDDISAILERGVDAERIASLLRIRRAEVEQEHRIAAERLVDVERRLHLIEREKHMSRIEIVEKPLPAVRLAAVRTVVPDQRPSPVWSVPPSTRWRRPSAANIP